MTGQELFERLNGIFAAGGVYEIARGEFIALEEAERGRLTEDPFVEFRDALDHVKEAFQYISDDIQVGKHIDEIETHLWRVAIECAECRAEMLTLRLQKRLAMGTWWWKLLGIDPSISAKEIINSCNTSRKCIIKGRERKGERGSGRLNAYEQFKNSCDMCQKSLDSIQQAAFWGKIGALVLVIFGAILATTLKAVADLLIRHFS